MPLEMFLHAFPRARTSLGSCWEPLGAPGSLWEPLGTPGSLWELLGMFLHASGNVFACLRECFYMPLEMSLHAFPRARTSLGPCLPGKESSQACFQLRPDPSAAYCLLCCGKESLIVHDGISSALLSFDTHAAFNDKPLHCCTAIVMD
jgi:hypothetical protein